MAQPGNAPPDALRSRVAAARRRGRPTPQETAAISQAIVSAATEAFLAEGYERASMEAIAARAGVPKRTVYKRYPDKKALLREVLTDRLAAWSRAKPDRNLGDDLETRLKHHAAAMLVGAISPEIRAFFNLVVSAWSGPDDAVSRKETIGYTAMVERLAGEIRAFGPDSGIHAREPERAAVALMAMLTGWIHLEAAPTERAEDKAEAVRFAHAAVELLMRGAAAW